MTSALGLLDELATQFDLRRRLYDQFQSTGCSVPRAKKSNTEMAVKFGGAVELINGVLNPSAEPILGLYVYAAADRILRSIRENAEYRPITAHLIGTPAVLSVRPGISQSELAQLLGCERMTAGLQVEECIRRGWVRRRVSTTDRRAYQLYLTTAGGRMLDKAVPIIARHENVLAAGLTGDERVRLCSLLKKFIAALDARDA
jgi:DNA-binding MarR family transcriptional regulator